MNQFFSVTQPTNIAGKVFIPCVSYELFPNLFTTITSLVASGKARIYDSHVAFESGKAVVKVAVPKKQKKTFEEAKKAVTSDKPAISEKDAEVKEKD